MISNSGTSTLGLYDLKRQIDAFGGVDYFRPNLAGGYLLNARVMLANGEIVQNGTNGNLTNDPNTDMTGWVKTNDASFIVDGNENQKQINEKTIRQVESISDLTTIANPKKGQAVYVNSFYPSVVGTSHPFSGGDNFTFYTTTETPIQGFIVAGNGGYWKRKSKESYSIDDFGAHPSKNASINSTAINIALSAVKNVCVPTFIYNVNTDQINLNSGNHLFGLGTLQGQDPDTKMIADVSGTLLRINGVDNAKVSGVTIKNGYKAKGVWMTNSKNITFEDVCIDGFSYGIWCGEDDDFGVGCQNIKFIRPRILNTRYWGIYVRCLDVVDEAKKTKNIWCEDPYFYNCNMAAFVCAEGHVSGVSLINPVFERCNVCMHFESATNYTVVNPRDYDTGKKADHVQANTEYPYVNWSMYHAFCSNAKIIGGKLEKNCYHYAANGGGSEYIEYIGTTALDHVFEGGGSDSAKVFFQNYKFSDCTTTGVFIYQLNGADNYLRNFEINNCKCLLGQSVGTGSGDGNLLGIYAPRTVNFEVRNSKFFNCMLRISGYGNMFVTGNSFVGGTNNSQCRFRGLAGGQLGGDVLQFTGNTFERAGGAVLPDSAFLIENFSVVRTDNIMQTTCNFGYRFTNNFRVEYGKSYVLGWTSGAYTETGTTEFVTL